MGPTAVDWALAERVAVKVAQRAPFADAHLHGNLIEEFTEHTALAEGLVAATTGLASDQGSARARVVDRSDWIRANLASLQRLLRPLFERMGDQPETAWTKVTAQVTAVEMGAVLGWMSTRVLGQYDLLVIEDEQAEDQDLVYYVGPNIVALERRSAFPPTDFRLWLALHEVTHRAQFTGVPWMRGHYLGLVETLLDQAEPEPQQLADRLRSFTKDKSDNNESMLSSIATPEQKLALDGIAGLMSLLEGHGDVTMDRAGIGLVEHADRYARVMRHRRQSATGLTRLIQKAIGLEAKLAQYIQGEEFIAAVETAGGDDLFNRVWEKPAHLPSSAEIQDPQLWVTRMTEPAA
ncbi:MAG: zinc-dependent metalloprotease [Acidimicrobiales bacterium]